MTDIAERWEKNLEHLMSGGFGDTIHAETLLNYWYAQADAGYPGASENVKYFEEMCGIERKEYGEWIPSGDGINPIRCSRCNSPALFAGGEGIFGDFEITRYPSRYCPECGAKMKGK